MERGVFMDIIVSSDPDDELPENGTGTAGDRF